MITSKERTICAISTPYGKGGIAVIRISGNQAIKICNKIFNKDLSRLKGYQSCYGSIIDKNKTIDDVIVNIFKNPNSFTGEDIVEISCHGSIYIQQKIIELLINSGCNMAQAGEFSQRAFLNGKMDLSQTEAIADLINTESSKAHEIAIKQIKGGFSNELKQLRIKLLDFASLIELELDFSEEDVEFADRSQLTKLVEDIALHLFKLKESFKLGNAIKNGVKTVIAGRPNAGKSTLLNKLVNEQRAIVSDIPGTTRDSIEELINIKGINFRLIDTAGLRKSEDKIEKIGIKKTLKHIDNSSLIIYIYDVVNTRLETVNKDIKKLNKQNLPTIIIANKADLQAKSYPTNDNHLLISALKNEVQIVKDEIFKAFNINKLDSGDTIITNARHYDSLNKAYSIILDVKNGLEINISSDLLAIDIRQALHNIGEITGEISNDELLGNIFGKFCIGK